MRWHRLAVWLGVGLATIALIGGCSSGTTTTPGDSARPASSAATPTQAATQRPTAAPTVVRTPVPPSAPGLVADGALDDAADDLADERGKPVRTLTYVDIRKLTAAADGSTLRLTLTLAGALPAAPLPTIEVLRYIVFLHTDDNAVPERDDPRVGIGYGVVLMNRAAGDYYPVLTNWETSDPVQYGGSEFPGTAVVAGDTVILTVRLAALGNPHVIRIAVETKRADYGIRGAVTAEDDAPAAPWTGGTQDWLQLGS